MRADTTLEWFSREKRQYRGMAALSASAAGLVGSLPYSNAPVVRDFIGRLNSLAAAICLAVLAWVLFALLPSRGSFLVYSQERGLNGLCGHTLSERSAS